MPCAGDGREADRHAGARSNALPPASVGSVLRCRANAFDLAAAHATHVGAAQWRAARVRREGGSSSYHPTHTRAIALRTHALSPNPHTRYRPTRAHQAALRTRSYAMRP
eukprot:1558482-Rhodomonas_salina.1